VSRRDDWRIEPHVCRVCFGRVVSRELDEEAGDRQYVCTNCGLEAKGHRVACLCACGTKVRKGKGAFVDAGLRCHENNAKSPEFPALYVASFGGAQPETDT
jgi:hypothetical protein